MTARISLTGSVLTVNGVRHQIPRQAKDILWLLMTRPLATREDCCNTLWPGGVIEPDSSRVIVRRCVGLLRRLLAEAGWEIRNEGYRGWRLEHCAQVEQERAAA